MTETTVSADRDGPAEASRLSSLEVRFSLNSGSFRASLKEIAPLARKAGFGGLELWTHDIGSDHSSQEIHALLEANQLQVSAFQLLRDYEGLPDSERSLRLQVAERLMSEIEALGATTLLVCANTSPHSSGDGAQIAKDLRILAEMAAHRGIRVAFEPLAWSRWLNNYELAAACMEAVGHSAFGLTIDAFHWFWADTPTAFVRELSVEKCFNVQLCDAKPNGLPALTVARHHRLFPGEGDWPVVELARALADMGYQGYFNVEVFNDRYKALPAEVFVGRAVQSLNAIF